MILGAAMVGTSIIGKSFIYVYRTVKMRQYYRKSLGKCYYGGFQSVMTTNEAALILGINL